MSTFPQDIPTRTAAVDPSTAAALEPILAQARRLAGQPPALAVRQLSTALGASLGRDQMATALAALAVQAVRAGGVRS